jgi:group I intron endonuclease
MLESYKGVSGIYAIVNLKDGKRYVGSAACLRLRARQHIAHLFAGRHFNRHLQSAWNRDGAHSFRFDVLEVVSDKALLTAAEQTHMDAAIGNRYNLRPLAHSNYGLKLSDETKEKVRQANIGKRHSEETKRRMSATRKGAPKGSEWAEKIAATKRGVPRSDVREWAPNRFRKFTDAQVLEIKAMRATGATYRAMAKQLNCSIATISFVLNGKGICYAGG